MKVLIVNTYHYLRGGDCRQAFDLAELLKRQGHQVYFFAMKNELNVPCPEEEYFVSEIDYLKALRQKNPLNILRVILRSIYSFEAKNNIARLLDKIKPDIAHLHSLRHHLTKSILPQLARRNIPVVWTLHDFKEICPNTSFYDGRAICEKCRGGKYANVIWNRCKKGSLPASVITYIESKVNDRVYFDKYISRYIAPSQFLRDKYVEYGFENGRISHIPNYMDIENFTPNYGGQDYFLFLGRLGSGKGVSTLIKGFKMAAEAGVSSPLIIAGTGEREQDLKALARRLGADTVRFVGYKTGDELEDLTRNARAVILPSELYENYPFSVLEAMAYGKPVIASRIGGIPEQVEDGVTGLLFEPFNAAELCSKIQALGGLPQDQIEEMGRLGRQKVEQVNGPDVYLDKILTIYHDLVPGWQ